MVTMEVKLLIPSVYCDTGTKIYIGYTLTGYRAGVMLRYINNAGNGIRIHINTNGQDLYEGDYTT